MGLLQFLEMYLMVVGGIGILVWLATLIPVSFWAGGKEIPLGYYFAFMFFGGILLQICYSLLPSK